MDRVTHRIARAGWPILCGNLSGQPNVSKVGCGQALLYELPVGKPPRVLVEKNRRSKIGCLAFSPDGKTLAAGLDSGAVKLWDLTTGVLHSMSPGHNSGVTSLAYSPDGRIVASDALDGMVILWAADLRQVKWRIERPQN